MLPSSDRVSGRQAPLLESKKHETTLYAGNSVRLPFYQRMVFTNTDKTEAAILYIVAVANCE